ncbi:MAG: hypothetical protein SFV51_02190 [Bryobacteraceae bacterium]|nr:hypothetical protein [Bryobacteraceae bacterium]
MEEALPSLGSGPVARVWFSEDGAALNARTAAGQIWRTADFESWKPVLEATPPDPRRAVLGRALPETGAQVLRARGTGSRWYAFGRFVYRSDDGQVWSNLTAHRNESILGGELNDMDVSPSDPDDIVVANAKGVWRSLDGGLTWSGLNDSLPALTARKLLTLPNGNQPVKLLAGGADPYEIEWAPGERVAWRTQGRQEYLQADRRLRGQLSARLGATVTAAVVTAEWTYAGGADGRLWASADRGQTWQSFLAQESGRVNAIYVNPREPRIALAAVAGRGAVLRTLNGGLFWDDATSNLPPGGTNGITADPASGSIYVATSRGVFQTTTALNLLGAATPWSPVSAGLPTQHALDVRLDEAGNQLYVLLEGWGLFAGMAPHRSRQISVVNAADFSGRPAAPGTLLSILGSRVTGVRAGDQPAPVLGSTDSESQIQVPFEVSGDSLALTLESPGRAAVRMGLPLAAASPAIFIARDGAPLLLDADSGVALDAGNPARSATRIQILVSGLGAVNPAWPTGVPAPAENVPRVVAPVRVYVDREPVEVTRATLAPGYVGFYVVEVQLPMLVNAGPAELYLEAGNQQSNRVRLYLAP